MKIAENTTEQKEPSVQTQAANLKAMLPLKRLQVEFQKLNTDFIELRVREMEAVTKMQLIQFEQQKAEMEQQKFQKENVVEHTITEEDLKNNPEMVGAGIKVGQVIGIPKDIYKDLTLSNKVDLAVPTQAGTSKSTEEALKELA